MKKFKFKDPFLFFGIAFLVIFSVIILRSVASTIFPVYWVYLVIGVFLFSVFSQMNFGIFSAFRNHLYIFSLIFLALPLLIGQVTRGAVRWIPIGALTIQPAEIVRPFLILFWAHFLEGFDFSINKIVRLLAVVGVPIILILLQPSLGVATLTLMGFAGVFFATGVDRKLYVFLAGLVIALIPISWFLLADYQRARIVTFLSPQSDPSGAGYNALQSMIAVGSGRITGRGIGEGVQTQLLFLPERHSDFIFASIAEELGLLGAGLILAGSIFVLSRVVVAIDHPVNPVARAFVSGIFLTLFSQVMVHIGMDMGLFPITGVPLPLVSAGGSSLIATMMMLSMVIAARKD